MKLMTLIITEETSILKMQLAKMEKQPYLSPDELVYDTLPNGKIMLKRLPGDLDKVPIDEEETFLRQNFSESDNQKLQRWG